MYSQANVRVESVLRPPTRALPSVIVDTEKVLREADGPEESDSTKKSASRRKGDRSWVRRESLPEQPAGSPKITSGS